MDEIAYTKNYIWKIKKKQEAFRERRHLHVYDLWPWVVTWVVTLTLSQGQIGLCHSMSLIVLYLGTRYDVCECNSLRHMTICSFLWHLIFACDLHCLSRSLSSLLLNERYINCFVFVPSTKFVGSIEFEIWTIVWRKLKWRHYDVITD